ncbi:unnamed protein product [Effrenium voratum]|nr:unnamed protein product [Effrenium voratum]
MWQLIPPALHRCPSPCAPWPAANLPPPYARAAASPKTRRGCGARAARGAEGIDWSPLPKPQTAWALVTGAATGLGFRLAAACARCGYGVILTDDAPTLSLEAELASFKRVRKIPAKLSDPSDGAASLYKKIKEDFSMPDSSSAAAGVEGRVVPGEL